MATNDWTAFKTEPPITFWPAFTDFYDICIIFVIRSPTTFLGYDGASGVFRHLKYHPNLVGMHASFQAGFGVLNTSSTFGGCTTPLNWNAVACARQELAQYLWWAPDTEVQEALLFLASNLFF
jgi:hypothetical protein